MKAYGAADVQIHVVLTSVLVGEECSASRPARLIPGKRAAGDRLIRDRMDPRGSLDNSEKGGMTT
jgi:hypothetical protein